MPNALLVIAMELVPVPQVVVDSRRDPIAAGFHIDLEVDCCSHTHMGHLTD